MRKDKSPLFGRRCRVKPPVEQRWNKSTCNRRLTWLNGRKTRTNHVAAAAGNRLSQLDIAMTSLHRSTRVPAAAEHHLLNLYFVSTT
jgi:hypothetical protein